MSTVSRDWSLQFIYLSDLLISFAFSHWIVPKDMNLFLALEMINHAQNSISVDTMGMCVHCRGKIHLVKQVETIPNRRLQAHNGLRYK